MFRNVRAFRRMGEDFFSFFGFGFWRMARVVIQDVRLFVLKIILSLNMKVSRFWYNVFIFKFTNIKDE